MLLNRKNNNIYFRKVKGFTLMEVIIALAITAISLIPLLHLLISSISTVDATSCISYASLIANEKLAETVSKSNPENGTESGSIDNEVNNIIYKWQVNITDLQQDELEELNLSDLKKVSVCVSWKQGQTQKQVCMSSLISPGRAVTETVSHNNGN